MSSLRVVSAWLVALVVVFAPAAASAATLTESPAGTLVYTAAAGEPHQLLVDPPTAAQIRFTDPGALIAQTATNCTISANKQVATCGTPGASGSAITALSINLGDQDDTAKVNASLPATIRGGGGTDRLTGGPKSDKL